LPLGYYFYEKIKEIRKEFAERFFPNLLQRAKGNSYFDDVEAL
jgi:hypothetical protein